MSLKAKIEAVIYAAEEPVTLAQLAGLLGHEAQAELDQLASAQQTLSLNETEEDLEEAAESDPTLAADYVLAPASKDEPAKAEVFGEAAASAEVSVPDPKAFAREEKEAAQRLREYLRRVVDQLIAEYATSDRGLEIREVAGGFRISTKPEYHDAVRGFVKSLKPPLKLTLQALETLAVVAYKQPVTAPEISEIRGVDSGGVLGSLMARKLITTAGRKPVIGRPILYKTTKDFLLRFGLKDLNELPSIEEFEKMAGELADIDPAFHPAEQATETKEAKEEDSPMQHNAPETSDQVEPQRDTHDAQPDGIPEETDNRRAEDGDTEWVDREGAVADEASVDGRMSGLPPVYDDASDDPSAEEAAIQKRENPDA